MALLLWSALVQESIDGLVERLGDDRVEERDKAEKALIERGIEIEAEIRKRAAAVRDSEMAARLGRVVRALGRKRIGSMGRYELESDGKRVTYSLHGVELGRVEVHPSPRAETKKDEAFPVFIDAGRGYFTTRRKGAREWELVEGDPHEPGSRLRATADRDVTFVPKGWSPDSRYLILYSWGYGFGGRDEQLLQLFDSKENKLKEIFREKPTAEGANCMELESFQWSPDGRRFLFLQRETHSS